MYRLQLGLAVAAAVSTGGWWSPSWDAADIQAVQGTAAEPAASPPAAWLPADPADSLYKAARDALNRREYRTAADLFAQIPARYPKSGYAGDALYWQAFALYRRGPGAGAAHGARRAAAPARALRGRRHQGRRRRAGAADPGRARAGLRRRGRAAGDRRPVALQARGAAGAARSARSRPRLPKRPSRRITKHMDHDDRCSDDDDMKIAALNALIHMDSDKARPILTKVLARRDAASVCLRRKAVFLISQGDNEGTEEILLNTARTDPDTGGPRAGDLLALAGGHRSGRSARWTRSSACPPTGGSRTRRSSRSRSRTAPGPSSRCAPSPSGPTRRRTCASRRSSGSARAAARRPSSTSRHCFRKVKGEELKKKVLFSVSQADGDRGREVAGGRRPRSRPSRSRSGSRRSSGPARAARRWRISRRSTARSTTGK